MKRKEDIFRKGPVNPVKALLLVMSKENVYEYHYNTGKYHHDIKIKMELPSAADSAVGFRGYMDGYSGREFKVPSSPALIIDKLHENGMKTITGKDQVL